MAGNRHVTGLLSNKKKKVKMKKNDVYQKRKMRANSFHLDTELDFSAVKRFAILLNLVLTSIYCNDNHGATAYKSKDRGMFQLILLCCYAVGNDHNTGLRYNKKKKVKMKTDVESCCMKSLEDQFYLESGTTKRSNLCLSKMLVKFVLRMLLLSCSDKFSRTLQYPRHSPNEISKSSWCCSGTKVLLKPVLKDKIQKVGVSTMPHKSIKSSDVMHTPCNADRYTSRETSSCCISHLKRLLGSGDLVLILALRNGRVLMFTQFSLEKTSFSCSVLRCVDKNSRWSGLACVLFPFAVLVDSGIRAECVSVHGRNGSMIESRYSRFRCDISSLLFRINAICSSELDNELYEHIGSPILQNGIPKQLIYYLLGCCVPLLSCMRSLGRIQICAPDLEQRGQGQALENLSKIVNRSRFRSRIRFYRSLLVWICNYMIQVICLLFPSRVGNGRMAANYDQSEEVKYVSNCCRMYCTLSTREYYVPRYVSLHRKYESPALCLLSGYDKHVRKKSNLKSLQSYLRWRLSKKYNYNYLSSLFNNDCRLVVYSNKLSKKRRYSLGTLDSYKYAKVIVDSVSLFFNGGRFPNNFEDQSGLMEAVADSQCIFRISQVSNESLCVMFISCGFYKFQVTISRSSGFNEGIYYKSDKYEVVGFEFFVDRLTNVNDNYLLSVNDSLSNVNEYMSSVDDRLTSVNDYLQNTNDKLCYSSLLRDYDNYVQPREEHRLETNVKCLFQFGSHDISTSQEGDFESLISVCPVCRSVHTETYTTFHLPNDYFVCSVSTEQLRQSLILYRNETDEISGISFLSHYEMASKIVADAQDERITSETFENVFKYNNYYSNVIPQDSPCNMLESFRSTHNRQSTLSVDRSTHNRQSTLSVDSSIHNQQSKLCVDSSIHNQQSKLSVDSSIHNQQSKLSVDSSIHNKQSKMSVDSSIHNQQSKLSVDSSIHNQQSKQSVDSSIHNKHSKLSVDSSIHNQQSTLSVDSSIHNKQSKMSVDSSIHNQQSKQSVDSSIHNKHSKLSVDSSIHNKQSKLSLDSSIYNQQSKLSVDSFESIAHASSGKRVQHTLVDNFSKNYDYSRINAYR